MIVEHDTWSTLGAYHPDRLLPFEGPALAVVQHHSVTPQQGGGVTGVRTVDQITKNRGVFSMVPYSALGPANGLVYLGRGDQYRNGANRNTKGGTLNNRNTLSYCYVGDYRTDEMNDHQVDGFLEFCDYMVERGSLIPDFDIVPHGDLSYTECPAGIRDDIPALKLLARTPRIKEETDMFVLKLSPEHTWGWVFAGPRVLRSESIDHWEGVVGPSRVFISGSAQRYMQLTDPVNDDKELLDKIAKAVRDQLVAVDVNEDEIAAATIAALKEAL